MIYFKPWPTANLIGMGIIRNHGYMLSSSSSSMMYNYVQVLCEQRVPPPLLLLDSSGAPLTVRGTPGWSTASSLPSPPSDSWSPLSFQYLRRHFCNNQCYHYNFIKITSPLIWSGGLTPIIIIKDEKLSLRSSNLLWSKVQIVRSPPPARWHCAEMYLEWYGWQLCYILSQHHY